MEVQALEWIARTNKGCIGPEKKDANEALRQNSPITSQKLGKVMKRVWETSIPRDGNHHDKHATLGWPSQTEAKEALRAIVEGDGDDYTKMAAVR